MGALQLTEGIYFVGMQNPNLRVFDIIVQTEFGTSYNSYLVKGDGKTALIDTVHADFAGDYIALLSEEIGLEKIDYLILNHTEPDHSGAVRALLGINPDIVVVASAGGVKNLSNIMNMPFKSHIVKDGETLDLGGRTLRFISAPLLHWPDTMFTYIQEDAVLFTCDFLGCHYCEPLILDTRVLYPELYARAFDAYFDVIFTPFREAVLSGLEKIEDLELRMVCPSHGPVLVSGVETARWKYYDRAIAVREKRAVKKALILYVSAYGYTCRMAEELRDQLEGDHDVEMLDASEHGLGEIAGKINNCDGLLLGTPTINRDALKPIWDVTTVIDAISNKGKPAGVFGSYGWSGEGVGMIVERLRGLKLGVVGDGVRAVFNPDDGELAAVRDYALQFAAALHE